MSYRLYEGHALLFLKYIHFYDNSVVFCMKNEHFLRTDESERYFRMKKNISPNSTISYNKKIFAHECNETKFILYL